MVKTIVHKVMLKGMFHCGETLVPARVVIIKEILTREQRLIHRRPLVLGRDHLS
jgi:hypothetical protein